jgi:hypothetical protein
MQVISRPEPLDAVERPDARVNGELLLVRPEAKVAAVDDAVSVGDEERDGPSFWRLPDRFSTRNCRVSTRKAWLLNQELPCKHELLFPHTVRPVVIRPDAVGVYQASVGDAS